MVEHPLSDSNGIGGRGARDAASPAATTATRYGVVRGGHPWVFMLAFGTMVTALVEGDLGTAALMAIAVVWTVRR